MWFARPEKHWTYIIRDQQLQPLEFPGVIPDKMRYPIALEDEYFIYASRDSFIACKSSGEMIASSPAFQNHTASDENRVFEIFEDRQSNLWVATVDGLYKISVLPNYFETFNEGFSTHGLLPEGNRLWATGKEYFAYLDIQTGQRRILAHERPVNSFFKDSEQVIWGLSQWSRFMRYTPDNDSLRLVASPHIVSMLDALEKESSLWVGTHKGVYRTGGLYSNGDSIHMDLVAGQTESNTMKVRALLDRGNEVWAAGTKGLMIFDADAGGLLRHIGEEAGLPFTDLNHLYVDEAGNCWLASRGGGLIRWNPKKNDFRQFTIQDGLSNDNIYAVMEDGNGTLWLPSDYGLMCFEKESGDVRVFHRDNGLLHEEFNTLSYARDSLGFFYFGGLRGVVKFHPDSLSSTLPSPNQQLLASEIRVLEGGANSYEDRLEAYTHQNQVELAPNDQLLEIKVSNLDFTGTQKKELAYRLQGYHPNWIYPTGNLISLMNPPYGNYTLQVKARSSSGIWLPPSLEIPIQVRSPYYYNVWFWLTVFVLLSIALWGMLRLRIRSLKNARNRMEIEVKKRTQTIAQQAEELEELSQVKSRFFSNITHEFRTPLTLIIGPLKQILSAPLGKETPLRLQGVLRNSESLLGLINQLLDISKLEHGKMEVERKHGDIAFFTQDLLTSFIQLANQKGISLVYTVRPENIELEFDRDKWEKVLNNLLSNAIKFTPSGGRIDVELSLEKEEFPHQLQLKVRDTGVGIAPEDWDKVFDRFYQPSQPRYSGTQGTGIGLALVKELIELQGGNISVTGQPDEGCEFTVLLPFAAPTPLNLEQVVPQQDGKLRLLLIEDNDELRAYIRSCFAPDLYEIWEASDGSQGVALARELVPDLIISDIMMPNMDGFEVTQHLRQHLATSHIPIILLTAKSSLESRLEGLRKGADAYLSKPFSPEELRLRVEKLIALRELYKERFRPSRDAHQLPPSLPPDHELDPSERFMADLKSFVTANLANPELKVSLITHHFGISRAQFYRKLQSISELGVSELIRSARCEAALQLIRQQECTMAEIAYEVGFSSPSQFSRSFKTHYGKSPKELQGELSLLAGSQN